MMKTLAKISLLFTLVSILPACDSALGGTPAAPKVNIAGTWTCVDGPITTSYQFRADGTVTKSVALPRNIPPEAPLTGTWVLHDDLSMDVKLGDYDESHEIRVNGSKMSIITSNGQTFYRR